MTLLQQMRVLLYHHVGAPQPGAYPILTVSPEHFRKQIKWLADHRFSPIRISQWPNHLPEKPVLITFDDAYADITKYALPVLRDYGFTATIFVVTGQIGCTNEWDKQTGYTMLPLMNAAEIQFWSQQGFDFASHSRTHPHLTKLSDEELEKEVRDSWIDLRNLLDNPAKAFAYPYGTFDSRVRNCVSKFYDLAFTIEVGTNRADTDHFLLRRAWVRSTDGILGFPMRVYLGKNPLDLFEG